MYYDTFNDNALEANLKYYTIFWYDKDLKGKKVGSNELKCQFPFQLVWNQILTFDLGCLNMETIC